MQPAEIDRFAYLCQALTLVGGPEALSVLNPSTGKLLKHCQLRHDPHYKATWDMSTPMNSDVYAKALSWVLPPTLNGLQSLTPSFL
jgi:hypothetical protein